MSSSLESIAKIRACLSKMDLRMRLEFMETFRRLALTSSANNGTPSPKSAPTTPMYPVPLGRAASLGSAHRNHAALGQQLARSASVGVPGTGPHDDFRVYPQSDLLSYTSSTHQPPPLSLSASASPRQPPSQSPGPYRTQPRSARNRSPRVSAIRPRARSTQLHPRCTDNRSRKSRLSTPSSPLMDGAGIHTSPAPTIYSPLATIQDGTFSPCSSLAAMTFASNGSSAHRPGSPALLHLGPAADQLQLQQLHKQQQFQQQQHAQFYAQQLQQFQQHNQPQVRGGAAIGGMEPFAMRMKMESFLAVGQSSPQIDDSPDDDSEGSAGRDVTPRQIILAGPRTPSPLEIELQGAVAWGHDLSP